MIQSKTSINGRFLTAHKSSVRSVSFNPKERYIFCSAANDGQICIYHAGRGELLSTHPVISTGLNRFVSSVVFASDGKKILAAAAPHRVSVIDIEHGAAIVSYDNCAYSGSRDRTPLAVDPNSPNIAVCSYVNGKGVTVLDLRMPLPLDFTFDFHNDIIRDIVFLNDSWPFSKQSSSTSTSLLENNVISRKDYTLLTLSSQGVAKVTSLDGGLLHSFDYGHLGNSIVTTPEPYGASHDNFTSAWICGGDYISSYIPNDETIKQQQQNNAPVYVDFQDDNYSGLSHIHFNHGYIPLGVDASSSGSTSNNDNRNNQTSATSSGGGNTSSGGGSNSAAGLSSSDNSNSGVGPSGSSSSSSNQGFNVIISNPNNVNLNVYMPRRSELIFGNLSNIETLRLSRAIQSMVSSSSSQSGSNNNNSQQSQSSGSSGVSVSAGTSSPYSRSLVLPFYNGLRHINPQGSLARNVLRHIPNIRHILLEDEQNRSNNNRNLPHSSSSQQRNVQNFNNNNDGDDDDEDDDDDDDSNNYNHGNNSTTSGSSKPKIDIHTPINSFVKKTQFYHDYWDKLAHEFPYKLICRMRFSRNGAHLYVTGEGGFVRAYRRYPNLVLSCLGELYHHRGDVLDMDISLYDEYIVTASRDKTVGLFSLGLPSHGSTTCYEFT